MNVVELAAALYVAGQLLGLAVLVVVALYVLYVYFIGGKYGT